MTFAELKGLAATREVDAESVMRAAYEWRRESLLTVIRGCLAFAASFVVAGGLALFKGEIHPSKLSVLAVSAGTIGLVTFGSFLIVKRLPRLAREYVIAVRLFDALKRALP